MTDLAALGAIAGGIGLFLLGMGLMTDGLKLAAGPSLDRILANSTKTRLRGLASGSLITAMVQSSSAVTIATIGFVNAGLLNLSQAVWVLFGANVGTTMTGWLVALVGLKFKIEVLALPLIGIGMILRLTGESHKRGALGTAMAGFGVLFLGIDLLGKSFANFSTDFTLPAGDSGIDVLAQVLIGIALTILMQSSSAALAVALTAAQGGLLTAQGAAAVVIGANIGTTVTAVIAALGATPNAKRAASAHILFNLLTACVALVLLPWLVGLLHAIGTWLELDSSPAARLALFHTTFNILGVMLIWPMAARMTRFLEARFHRREEDEGRPRHIDRTVLAVPSLALDALEHEVRRLGSIALRVLLRSFATPPPPTSALVRDRTVVLALNRAIAEFIVELNRSGMSAESAHRLPQLLKIARYYEASVELAREAVDVANRRIGGMEEYDFSMTQFLSAATRLVALIDPTDVSATAKDIAEAFTDAQSAYQSLKDVLLDAGAQGSLTVEAMDVQLRFASVARHALDQATKAARMLSANNETTQALEGAGEAGDR